MFEWLGEKRRNCALICVVQLASTDNVWIILNVKCFVLFASTYKGRLINRVLETQFSSGRHMEKTLYQMWSNHGNWVFETRDVSNIYSLKTVPTNYIVWQKVLISNFGPYQSIILLINEKNIIKFNNWLLCIITITIPKDIIIWNYNICSQ